MEICVEAVIRLFFVLIKSFISHWGLILTLLVLGFIMRKVPFLVSGIAFVLVTVLDLFATVLLETIIGTIIFLGMSSIILSFFFGLLCLSSKQNPIVKILMFPFYLLLGAILGIIPFAQSAIFIVEQLAGGKSLVEQILFIAFPLIVVIILLIVLPLFFGQSYCEVVNQAVIYLST